MGLALKKSNDEGISTDVMKQAGLVVERQDRSGFYDRFRGRVIFPIRDPQNRCVAFGGRILPGASPDAAKYINSPETPSSQRVPCSTVSILLGSRWHNRDAL